MKDITVFGHKVSPLAATAIGGGSLLVIWLAWKQHAAGAGTATPASAIDPLTGLPASQDNQPDPLTGEAYLAEAQQYGSVAAAEQSLSGTGLGSFSGGSPFGAGNGGGGTDLVPASTVQGTTYASNAAWAQAVEAGLTDIGYAPTDIAAALGRYLSNLSETPAQAAIIRAAVAEYGPPPVGSFQVIQAPAQPTPPAAPPKAPAVAPGGFSITPQPSRADAGWGTVATADRYELVIAGKGGKGTGRGHYDQAAATTHREGIPLTPGTYTGRVRAGNSAGYGPWTAVKTFTVKK